jgi:hypothetical protein
MVNFKDFPPGSMVAVNSLPFVISVKDTLYHYYFRIWRRGG